MKITQLKIFSQNIKEQLRFYKDELDFELTSYDETSFELQLGYSVLRFEKSTKARPYHFAFHIPDGQEDWASEWLKSHLAPIKHHGKEIIDFDNWKAKSVYFYDKDENIVELISRIDLNSSDSGVFNAQSIVGIAEIGMATSDISAKFKDLRSECFLNLFDGDMERFCAIGDASGLIICIDKNKKDWFPNEDKAYTSDFEMEMEHKNENFSISYKNDELSITKA
ncbi:VOC family protein [Gramella sp. AN32]|uniref:VOC family protein n=1 Tax=Christiangramia antarctica TaxID=2058158 RepID=A0ABW5X761_9FLAO|nr:VOC family protein [Gramella sp. AN32]MCM4157895.1 glyoxalase [Gramella sp. AN32]